MHHAGSAIQTLRETQQLSLRQLAALAGTSHSYLSRVERGQRDPSERWLRAVTDALGKNLAGVA